MDLVPPVSMDLLQMMALKVHKAKRYDGVSVMLNVIPFLESMAHDPLLILVDITSYMVVSMVVLSCT